MSSISVLSNDWRQASDGPDRRSHHRYPITLDVEYRLLNRGQAKQFGSSKTLNVGTGGVLFEGNDLLLPGDAIELLMNWPFLWKGVCPMRLAIRGLVVRGDRNGVAIATTERQFRTARALQDSKAWRQGSDDEWTCKRDDP